VDLPGKRLAASLHKMAATLSTPAASGTSPFVQAPCSGIMEGVTRAERFCFAEAQNKTKPGLRQEDVNGILLEQARCECRKAYAGTRPDVQLAFGRCAGMFAAEGEARVLTQRVTRCLDGDYGGYASERGLSFTVGGTAMTFADPTYEAPAYDDGLRQMRSTSRGVSRGPTLLWLVCAIFICGLVSNVA
jgi:hypothetical protein